MNALRWGAFALGLVAVACVPSLQVKTTFDHGADFRQFRTFRIADGPVDPDLAAREAERGTTAVNALAKSRIDRALRARLGIAGLAPGGPQADLVVTYVATVRTVVRVERAGFPYATYNAGNSRPDITYPGNYWVQGYPEGMLEIEIIDARTKQLVWQASCRSIGTGIAAPGLIEKAIDKAFRSYPPRTS